MATTSYDDAEKGSNKSLSDQINGLPSLSQYPAQMPLVALTREQYETLFQQQQAGRAAATPAKPAWTFGNPAPFGLIVFTLCLAPVAAIQMGWAGTDATANVAMIAPFYYLGGFGLILSGIMEWIVGNTLTYVLYNLFGGFWLIFGMLNDPKSGIGAFYANAGAEGARQLNLSLMFFFIFFAVMGVIFFITTLRTNVVFAMIIFTLCLILTFFSVSYGRAAAGDAVLAATFAKAAGGVAFVTCLLSYYMIAVMLFGTVGLPIKLPIGDLSTTFTKKTE